MALNTDHKKIKEILERGVEKIIEKKSLLKKLESGKRLRVKHGIDPTGPKIHIGRASQLWKLKAFQDLGHQIVLIIGDFTAQIGDASDKTSMRRVLTEEEIKENMRTYKSQIAKILDIKKVEVHRNSEWFNNLKLKEMLQLSMKFTAQQMIQRRNFKERWNMGKPIGIHELFYPILQGYDSKMVKADVEVGGFDQLFNLKIGREIQKIFGQKPQDIMSLKMLYGLDGRKMSTSWGNVVNILDNPKNIYGKVMSMKDELISDYFELCTRVSLKEAKSIRRELKLKKLNPRDAKARLAREIVKLYHGERAAEKAEEEFEKVFREKKLPSKLPVVYLNKSEKNKEFSILDTSSRVGLVNSKSEARRIISQGGITIIKNNREEKPRDWKQKVKWTENLVIKRGKRFFKKMKFR